MINSLCHIFSDSILCEVKQIFSRNIISVLFKYSVSIKVLVLRCAHFTEIFCGVFTVISLTRHDETEHLGTDYSRCVCSTQHFRANYLLGLLEECHLFFSYL